MQLNTMSWLSSLWKNIWLRHSVRTALAAGSSLAVAGLFKLSEAYWAPISTIIVMQSTLGAAWTVSKQRFIGTVLGAAFGGLLASYFEPHILLFAAAIFALGLICGVLHLDQSAYRFAGVTCTIIMLVTRAASPWLIALHRFAEVSLGIAVALVLSALWPERELTKSDA